ncbi:unnamed protein product [Orchesella dallaii]|uniref:Uncharacterized protein n=1 Tax=Orchesella dallaii TaxID=48710 RepID=A0ABP1QHK5_9HEXA
MLYICNPCSCVSLEKRVKAVAIIETLLNLSGIISICLDAAKYLRTPHPLLLDLDGKPQSFDQSKTVFFLLTYFVFTLLNIGLYCDAKEKKEGMCWLWLGCSTTFLVLAFIGLIHTFVTRTGMTEAIGNETYTTTIVYGIIIFGFKGYSIWTVFSYVKQLHHQRQGRQQLGLFLGDANVAGVGGKGQLPKVADDTAHSAEHQSSHVYQPTSTISTV